MHVKNYFFIEMEAEIHEERRMIFLSFIAMSITSIVQLFLRHDP